MNHPLSILVVLIALTAGGLPGPLLGAEQPVLRVLNWNEYLDPELAAEFGRRHGVRIKETAFDSDTERDRRLAAANGGGFDLAMVDAAQVPVYRDRGWIEAIGEARVPGLREMEPRWRQMASGTDSHAFPYAWGTVGIIYRADRITRPPADWLDLLRPAGELCGKIMVFGDARELVGTALKSLGLGANSVAPGDYQRVEDLLRAQKPCVARYETPGGDAESPLLTGEVWMAMTYSSDYGQLRELDPQVQYVLPEKGGLLWVDYLTVLAASKQKPLAMAFLQFLSVPANAARAAVFSQAATPNRKAYALLPPEMRSDPVMYPAGAALAASEVITTSTPAVMALRNRIQARIVGQ